MHLTTDRTVAPNGQFIIDLQLGPIGCAIDDGLVDFLRHQGVKFRLPELRLIVVFREQYNAGRFLVEPVQ